MNVKEICKQFEELQKPDKWDYDLAEKLHKDVVRNLDNIGNANPHWNKLNEIETTLRGQINNSF